jgi:hypothetical protein
MRAKRSPTRVSRRMETSVASGSGHICRQIAWIAIGSFEDCDFRDNRVGLDSYFDEADMNS